MVSFLLPLIGFTLNQLYQLKASGHFDWNWQYFAWSIMISSAAVMMALAKQFVLISDQKVSLLAKQVKTNTTDKTFLYRSLLFSAVSLVAFIFWPELNWHHIMLKYGILLVVAVAFLPFFLPLDFSAFFLPLISSLCVRVIT